MDRYREITMVTMPSMTYHTKSPVTTQSRHFPGRNGSTAAILPSPSENPFRFHFTHRHQLEFFSQLHFQSFTRVTSFGVVFSTRLLSASNSPTKNAEFNCLAVEGCEIFHFSIPPGLRAAKIKEEARQSLDPSESRILTTCLSISSAT